jgi:NTE family protein
MGAVVGGVYARTASAKQTQELTMNLVPTKIQVQRRMFDYTIPLRGIIRGHKIMRLLKNALKDADFLDLVIPAFVVAVDILTGEEVLLEKGKVHEAVRASVSIPGIFNPICLEGRWLVDGGLLQPVPVDVLIQKGADIVIAVCVERESRGQTHEVGTGPPTIIGQLSRTVNIMHIQATKDFAKKADIVLYPKVANIGWDEFHRGTALMRAGEEACRENIAEIKRLIEEKTR